MNTFHQSFDSSLVQVLGVNTREDTAVVRRFVDNFDLTYPILLDETGDVTLQYRIQGISPYPLDCIIDQNGIVRYLRSEYDPQFMLQLLAQMLPTGIAETPAAAPLPSHFNLSVYPNPTNSVSIIRFRAPGSAPVELNLYDVTGRRIRNHKFGSFSAGEEITFRLDLGQIASGFLFVEVCNGRFAEMQKLVLTR